MSLRYSRIEILMCDLVWLASGRVALVQQLLEYRMDSRASYELVHVDTDTLYELALALGVEEHKRSLIKMRAIVRGARRRKGVRFAHAISYYKSAGNRTPGYHTLDADTRISLAAHLEKTVEGTLYSQDELSWLASFEPILIDAILDRAVLMMTAP